MLNFSKPRRRIVLSHSRMSTFYHCQNAYKFAHYYPQIDYQEEDRGVTNFPMDVGTALHIAIQDYLEHRDYNQAIFRIWQNYPFALYERGVGDQGRTIFAAISAFEAWVDSGIPAAYELVEVNGKPSAELVGEIDLGSIEGPKEIYDFVYQCHVDAIVRRLTDGEIMPIDIKTYAGLNKLERYEYSTQLIPYTLISNMILERPRPLEFDSEYWFINVSLSDPKIDVKPIRKDQEDFKRWVTTIQQVARQIALNINHDSWPRNDGHCYQFGEFCPWAAECWSNRTNVELEEWYQALADGHPTRNSKTPDFAFRMQIL
jgi:hypothetical protein